MFDFEYHIKIGQLQEDIERLKRVIVLLPKGHDVACACLKGGEEGDSCDCGLDEAVELLQEVGRHKK